MRGNVTTLLTGLACEVFGETWRSPLGMTVKRSSRPARLEPLRVVKIDLAAQFRDALVQRCEPRRRAGAAWMSDVHVGQVIPGLDTDAKPADGPSAGKSRARGVVRGTKKSALRRGRNQGETGKICGRTRRP